MKRIHLIVISLIFVIITFTGCQSGNKPATAEFKYPQYIPQEASGFEILGSEEMQSLVISTHNPWQGADSVTTQLFISRNGESAPDGFTGQVVKEDPQRIVAMSSTYIAMLDVLGLIDRVVGVSGIEYISNSYIRNHRHLIKDVGYEGNINYEVLLALDPDIVLLYGVNGENPMVEKLHDLGIPYMYIGDYLEESPLGKAEWLVALAELAGIREYGCEIFNNIVTEYNNLKSISDQYSSDSKPSVMLNTPYGDSWFMPSTQSYMIRLISDAGGAYIYNRNTGNSSRTIDTEEAYLLTDSADKWINVGNCMTLNEIKDKFPKFAQTKPVIKNEIYNNNLKTNASGGNDFYESGVVNPHLILQDLIKIFHPEAIPNTEFTYYKHLE